MKSEIYHIPNANVELTKAEVAILMECSAAHYDGTCKAAGRAGAYGIVWQFTHDGKGVLTQSNVNLLLKVLEMSGLYYNKFNFRPEDAAHAGALTKNMTDLFFAMSTPRLTDV